MCVYSSWYMNISSPQFGRGYVSVLVAVEDAEKLDDLLVSLDARYLLLHE